MDNMSLLCYVIQRDLKSEPLCRLFSTGEPCGSVREGPPHVESWPSRGAGGLGEGSFNNPRPGEKGRFFLARSSLPVFPLHNQVLLFPKWIIFWPLLVPIIVTPRSLQARLKVI